MRYSSPPWLYAILRFSRDLFKWSSPSFCSTAFQNFQSISDVQSQVSKFQGHTKLCSNYRTLLASPIILSPICWWRVFWPELGTRKSDYGNRNESHQLFHFCLFCDVQNMIFFWRIFLTVPFFGNEKYVHNVITFFFPKCAFNLKCVVRYYNFVLDRL